MRTPSSWRETSEKACIPWPQTTPSQWTNLPRWKMGGEQYCYSQEGPLIRVRPRATIQLACAFGDQSLKRCLGHSPPQKHIYFLEAFAQIAAIWYFGQLLPDRVVCFIDNEAAKHALINGFGRDKAICNIIGAFWCMCSKLGIDPWFQRVSTHSNASDEISRDIWTLADQLQWQQMHFSIEQSVKLFKNMATDAHFAHAEGPTAICRDLAQQAAMSIKDNMHLPAARADTDWCSRCGDVAARSCRKCTRALCSECAASHPRCICSGNSFCPVRA